MLRGRSHSVAFAFVFVAGLRIGVPLVEGSDGPQFELVVAARRPLRVALDERVRLQRVGQPVTATLVESLYSYDRVVVPIGAKVLGHIEKLEGVSKTIRLGAMIGGDFTPLRRATLRFDTLILPDGREFRMTTRTKGSADHVARQLAKRSTTSRVARAREVASQKIRDALAPFKKPRRIERLKQLAIASLPYHPQYLSKGTVYTIELLEPLTFGTALSTERAPAGTPPLPDAVLNARLMTRLDSAKTPRGTPIHAVLIEPLFSADQRLILPEGTELHGEVTFATHARRFRRNGQLRFLFETAQQPAGHPEKLLASLYSSELSRNDEVTIDEEGGARIASSKARFMLPALGLIAVHASLANDVKYDAGEIGNAADIAGPNVGGRAIGGFSGLASFGTAVAQISKPVAGALAFAGLSRTVYVTLIGKGRDVMFPSDTSIQLQLSPASTKE